MENTFIVRYRRALHELKEAYRLQYALVDESDALRTLAYKQAHTVEKVILKNRKSGRGFLRSRLRECLDEEPYAWAVTQRVSREVEEMEGHGYDSEVSKEEAYELYIVIEEAISGLLEVFGSQFPKMLTGAAIVTYRGNVPVSELVLKFGPKHLQRIVRQRLKAAVDNPDPATTELPQLGSPALDTPPTDVVPQTVSKITAALRLRPFNPFPYGCDFTAEKADSLAHAISLIDEDNHFTGKPGKNGKDGKRAAKLAGFYLYLERKGLVRGSQDELRDYFVHRYLKEKITTTANDAPQAAKDVAKDTEKALKELFPALFQGKIKV